MILEYHVKVRNLISNITTDPRLSLLRLQTYCYFWITKIEYHPFSLKRPIYSDLHMFRHKHNWNDRRVRNLFCFESEQRPSEGEHVHVTWWCERNIVHNFSVHSPLSEIIEPLKNYRTLMTLDFTKSLDVCSFYECKLTYFWFRFYSLLKF